MLQVAPLRLTAVLGFVLLSACSHNRPPSIAAPTFPERISVEQRDQLYAAHALVCSGGECRRDDGAYGLDRLGPQAYSEAKLALKRHDDLEDTLQTVGFATTAIIAATGGVLLGVAAMDSSQYTSLGQSSDADAAHRTQIAGGSAYALAAAVAIISALIPNMLGDPDDEFEAAYNDALAADLDARVASNASGAVKLATP